MLIFLAILLAVLATVLLGVAFKQNQLFHENKRLKAKERIRTAALERRQRRYDQTLRHLVEATIVVGPDGIIESMNERAEELTGWTKGEVIGQHYSKIYIIEGKDGSLVDDHLACALRTGTKPAERGNIVLVTRSGHQLEIVEKVFPLFDDENEVESVLCFFSAQTEQGINQARIEQLTFKDSLTGLYNRTYFEEICSNLDTLENLPLSIMVGDLDGLKLTNDIFGHSTGDELIKLAADVLKENCRIQDVVFRWGGDEFVVFLPRTAYEEAETFKQELVRRLASRCVGPVRLHMPLGLATKESMDEDLRFIWQQADEEMYWLKTVGRSSFERQTLERICEELFSRSAGEKKHAENVSSLAVEFGEFLGFSNADLCKLRKGGYLHDVGKVALDPKILHKPYPLNVQDQHEMKRHPLVGFRLLNFFDETLDLAEAVLAHHERWDGSGYPKGLEGTEIPLLGRILAIIETYDRILHYPYVRQYTSEEALQLIIDGAGSKFDPQLVASFIKMVDGKK